MSMLLYTKYVNSMDENFFFLDWISSKTYIVYEELCSMDQVSGYLLFDIGLFSLYTQNKWAALIQLSWCLKDITWNKKVWWWHQSLLMSFESKEKASWAIQRDMYHWMNIWNASYLTNESLYRKKNYKARQGRMNVKSYHAYVLACKYTLSYWYA